MKILNTNRKRMHELVKKYSKYTLPAEKNTYFDDKTVKDKSPAYWMRFSDKSGKYVMAYLEIFMEEPTLRIFCRSDKYDQIFHLTPEDLEGMMEERKKMKIWVIRYMAGLPESFTGTEAEVEAHAEEQSQERECGYIIV